MHRRLAELLTHADRVRHDVLQLIDSVSDESWVAAPPGGGWSVGQHVGHLHLVEHSSVRALFRALRDAKAKGLGIETAESSVLGALDHTGLVEGTTKMVAPDFVTPTETIDRVTAVERLRSSREGLHTWAGEADGWALEEVSFPHPRLGNLNLYQWVLMIAGHEERHLRQMRAQLEGMHP